jgi:hypothetical protein
MPVYHKGQHKPRPAKRNPGRAPGRYDAQIPRTPPRVHLADRSRPSLKPAQKSSAESPINGRYPLSPGSG